MNNISIEFRFADIHHTTSFHPNNITIQFFKTFTLKLPSIITILIMIVIQ